MALVATDMTAAETDLRGHGRLPLAVSAIVRAADTPPTEATVRNLSRTGCLIVMAATVEIGSVISIGISGIGMVDAHIVHSSGDQYGCEFFQPISRASVKAAPYADTVVAFPNRSLICTSAFENTMPDSDRWSRRSRACFLMVAGIGSWAIAFGMLRLL